MAYAENCSHTVYVCLLYPLPGDVRDLDLLAHASARLVEQLQQIRLTVNDEFLPSLTLQVIYRFHEAVIRESGTEERDMTLGVKPAEPLPLLARRHS